MLLRILRELAHVADLIVVVESEGEFVDAARAIPCQVLVQELGVLRRSYLHPFGLINRVWHTLGAAYRLSRLIRRHDVRLVLTSTVSVLVGAFAARLARRPHLWFVQEILGGAASHLARLVTALSDQIITVSQASAQSIHRGRPRAMRKTVTHYPGVNVSVYDSADGSAFRRRFSTPDRPLLIGMVGRLHYWKGQDYFLDALHELKQRGVAGFRALIIGDIYPGYESLAQALHRKVRDLGLQDDVVFCGHLCQMELVYKALDIVVCPSTLPEPFGLVVAEAMAAGRAVIATRAGGPGEMIEDGVNGFLIPGADPTIFSARLELLLGDAGLRDRLGKAARQRVETLFPAAAFDRALRSIVEELLRRTAPQQNTSMGASRKKPSVQSQTPK